MDEIATSKFLSFVLRHKPESIGLNLDQQGWVEINELLSAMKAIERTLSIEQLFYLVETNDKQRFALSQDNKKIRANQGHSINVNLGYNPATPPAILYHGTAQRFLPSIKKNGLTRQNRHHVHLSQNKETAKLVGQRHGKLCLLKITSEKMHSDSYSFYKSANGVWLTEKVPSNYIIFQSTN